MSESKISMVSCLKLPQHRFTRGFKHQVVELLLNSGLAVAEVAREHELYPNQLRRWRNEYRPVRRGGRKPLSCSITTTEVAPQSSPTRLLAISIRRESRAPM